MSSRHLNLILSFWIPRLLLMAVLAVVACKGSDDVHDGGQHGGGGHVRRSSVEQVRTAIAQGVALIRDPKHSVLWDFAGEESVGVSGATGDRILSSHFIKARDNKEITAAFARLQVLDDGDCGRPEDNHADASVSAFEPSANICISAGNLVRLAPETLLQNVTALLVHEAVHLSGGDEDEAVFFQDRFSLYFASRFSDLSHDSLKAKVEAALDESEMQIMRTQHFAFHKVPTQIQSGLTDLRTKLREIPAWNDPVALNLALKPTHPERVDNYLNSIYQLMAMVDRNLHLQQSPAAIANEQAKGIDWVARFKAMLDQMRLVKDNWKAYLSGEGHVVCSQVPVEKVNLLLSVSFATTAVDDGCVP